MLQSKNPKKAKRNRPKPGTKKAVKTERIQLRPARTRGGTKQEAVLTLLRQPKGVTIAAMMEATGWQQHSVRGFLAGVVHKRLKLKLNSTKADGVRVYRIADGKAGSSKPHEPQQQSG